jgi:TctA family transporter
VLLSLFILLLYSNDVFSNRLLHYLAVLGIDTKIGRLRTAKNYSYMLAGIVYCVRVLVVETLLLAAQREEQTDDDCNRFLEKRKKYLADRLYSLISEMISLLAYSKYIGLNVGNLGNAN